MVVGKAKKFEPGEAKKFRFTPLSVAKIKWIPPAPDDKSKQQLYWDTERKGLTLLVGSKQKSFRLYVKIGDKWRWVGLGKYGNRPGYLTLAAAKAKAGLIEADVFNGLDPRKRRKGVLDPTKDPTYIKVVEEFIDKTAQHTQRKYKACKAVLENNFKEWHHRPFKSITRAEARTVIEGFIAQGKCGKAGTSEAWIRRLWRWATERDLIETPIMDRLGIDIPKGVRDRVYSDEELTAIWTAAGKLDVERRCYFRLLVLLAPRKSALANARWQDLREDGDILITPHKWVKAKGNKGTREYVTPLPVLAKQVLSELPRTHVRLFPDMPTRPGEKTSKALTNYGAPEDFGYHVVRHTAATWLQNNGHSPYEIGLVLNHASGGGVTSNYSHGHSTKLKLQVLEHWAGHIAKLVE
jgi:integrase